MQNYQHASEFQSSATKLFELISTPAFHEALAFRFGALEVSATETDHSDRRVKLQIEQLDSERGIVGQAMGGKQIRMVLLYDFLPPALKGTWSCHLLDHGQHVTFEGRLAVESLTSSSCRLIENGRIEFKIPLFGKNIEKKLLARQTEFLDQRSVFIRRSLTPQC